MADVTERNRGQLIIITALVIAAIFVALALVVNGAIYAENFATRDTGGDTRDVLEQRSNVEHEVQRVVDRANSDESLAIADAEKQINYNVDNLSKALTRSGGAMGKVVEVGVTATTRGEQLQQKDSNRNFTAGGDNAGAADWTLAENSTEAGKFEMTVNKKDLLDSSGDAANQLLEDTDDTLLGGMLFEEAFHVEITTESGKTWRVYMFQAPSIDEGDVYLYTQRPGEEILTINKTLQTLVLNESCAAPVTDGDTSINFRDAEAGGEPCEDLEFYEEKVVGEQHNISFKNTKSSQLDDATAQEIVSRFDEEGRLDELEDVLSSILGLLSLGDPTAEDVQDAWSDAGFAGDRAVGKYELVVDTEHSTTTENNFYNTNNGEPSSKTIVFSADTKMVYRSGDASLTTDGVEVKWSVADS